MGKFGDGGGIESTDPVPSCDWAVARSTAVIVKKTRLVFTETSTMCLLSPFLRMLGVTDLGVFSLGRYHCSNNYCVDVVCVLVLTYQCSEIFAGWVVSISTYLETVVIQHHKTLMITYSISDCSMVQGS